jgi:hypothetical protein
LGPNSLKRPRFCVFLCRMLFSVYDDNRL